MLTLTTYYIYRHIRPDTNQVFYIGKGQNGEDRQRYRRSVEKDRNIHWQRVVAKNSGTYEIEIMMEFDTKSECDAKEVELIALYGRSDLNKGTLVNLTDGGDGSTGRPHSQEVRARLREALGGKNHPNFGKKLSAETCRKKSEALKGAKHFLYGKKLPPEWRENMAAAKRGEKNPLFGKHSPISKKVKNTRTGVIYGSIAHASRVEGIKDVELYLIFEGHKPNNTELVLV